MGRPEAADGEGPNGASNAPVTDASYIIKRYWSVVLAIAKRGDANAHFATPSLVV